METLIPAAEKPALAYAAQGAAFYAGRLQAYGHTEQLRPAGDFLLSSGRQTMQHELVPVVLPEQLYRIRSLPAGSPYHRD